MSCTKVVAGKYLQECDSDNMYQGDFLELDNDWQYVRHVRIYVMKEKLCLAELQDHGHEGLLLDGKRKNCVEISRSCVNIDLVKGSPYTIKINVKHPEHETSIYQLCDGQEFWPNFLKSLDLSGSQRQGVKARVLPSVTFDDMDDYISDSESECSSTSGGSSGDELGLPRCFTLCVRGQGLGTMSTWNVNNAMMMMNPSHVRRLNSGRDTRRSSIDFQGLLTDSTESLRRSNSFPQINYSSKSERSTSLSNLADLDDVLVDEDLRYGNLKPKRDILFKDNIGLEKTKSGVQNTLNFLSTLQYRTEFGKQHANSKREIILNEQIGRLIGQPSSIKFINSGAKITPGKNGTSLMPICESVANEKFETVKTNEQPLKASSARPYEVIDTTGPKFKLSFRKFWKRREKLGKLGTKPDSSCQHEQDPEQTLFVNKLAVDYKCQVSSMPSYAVSGDRRGGLGCDASGKKEAVVLTSVTKHNKEGSSPAGLQVKEKNKLTPHSQPTFTGKDTIRKKIVKRILSPITILRSVSEEEKNTVDLPQTDIDTSTKQTKSRESLSQQQPKKLLDMNPLYLAQELTLIDKELLIRIPWNELSTCGWMTKDKYLRSPNVMSMVEFFNRIALVVASEILFEIDPIMRVRVISKVIQVANKLRSIGNFNSLKALLGGLQCTAIHRLKETWKEVSSKRKKNFRDLSKLMSEEDNFAAYRQELDSLMRQGNPCLPFLGDFLTQIAQTQTYLACRKKKSPPKKETQEYMPSSNESESSPPAASPAQGTYMPSPSKEQRRRLSLARKRNGPIRENEAMFSKSSPNLPASCIRVVERAQHYRANRFRRCRSWQHSNDSGILVNNSDNSSLSASSNSFLTSNTSLGSESFVCHTKTACANHEERLLNSTFPKRDLGRTCSATVPISAKNSVKVKLRRHRSVSERCLAVSESASSLKGRLSILRSFRRSKSMDQAPSSESIQRLYSTKSENGGSPGKFIQTNEKCKNAKSVQDTTAEESGTELQLWHFHIAAIQYKFTSHAPIKQFLLSTSFNTEEDNYKLSLQRDPPCRKSTNVS